jgi:predicted DNA-binding transcriptional regulator AlpA
MKLEKLLAPSDVANLLGITTKTLYNWRNLGRGPKFVRLGAKHGRVAYRPESVERYLESRETTTAEDFDDAA